MRYPVGTWVEAFGNPQERGPVVGHLAERVYQVRLPRYEVPQHLHEDDLKPVIPPAGDAVNHPPHYTWGPVEVIEITERLNFCLGNVIKYVLRADHKGKPIEDLEKAAWYLAREIERRKAESE